MTVPLPEPGPLDLEVKSLFLDYLDFYRACVEVKLGGLAESELRRSRLPSGWTPLELLKHLVFMERRWLRWGFAGADVPAPWGDHDADDRWHVDPDETLPSLLAALRSEAQRTRLVVEAAELDDIAAIGGRFTSADEAPTLGWILFHVLQEYARHAGHLDIARELVDGVVGE